MTNEEKKAVLNSILEDAKALLEKYENLIQEEGHLSITIWRDHLSVYCYDKTFDRAVFKGWTDPAEMTVNGFD